MNSDDKDTPKGFAGLEDMVSKLDEPCVSSVREPDTKVQSGVPRSESATAPQSLERQTEPATSSPAPAQFASQPVIPPSSSAPTTGVIWVVAFFAMVVIALVSQLNSGSKTVSTPPPSYEAPPAAAESAPTRVEQEIFERHFYKMRGSDGSIMEIEAAENVSDFDLSNLARDSWRPQEPYGSEELPPVGEGLLLTDDQIRYCLSQRIRLSGWNDTVNTSAEESVNTFNNVIQDFNSRCGNYKYETNSLDRIKADVEERRAFLDEDGRRHLGPRPTPNPPTYLRISARVETIKIDQPHARCAGSYEVVKCEALEHQLDQETVQQKQARQNKLENERQRNMESVNGPN